MHQITSHLPSTKPPKRNLGVSSAEATYTSKAQHTATTATTQQHKTKQNALLLFFVCLLSIDVAKSTQRSQRTHRQPTTQNTTTQNTDATCNCTQQPQPQHNNTKQNKTKRPLPFLGLFSLHRRSQIHTKKPANTPTANDTEPNDTEHG